MSAFPKYERYKDSGVEWLGEIPEHWDCRRNLGVFDERNERGRPNDELLSVTIQRGVIRQTEITTKKDSSNEDKSKYKVLKEGDLAYNKMRAWQGALGISPYNGICSPAYIILQPKNLKLAKYFHYLYRTPQFITEANRLSYGLCDDMNSLRYDDFKGSHSPLPPDDEVDRIVTFLDRKTAEIDALIARKQRQIELLDEQKAILINRAVTRGLNPNAKLKPSGIDWIGEIPEGWETGRLKHQCSHIVDCLHATPTYEENGEHPAIRTADITPGQTRYESARRISAKEFEKWTERLEPKAGDILYSREGERYGIAAPVPEGSKLCISQRMMVLRPKEAICSQFLMWQLNCTHVILQASQDVYGATSPHVNISTISNYRLIIPPREEQEEIAAWVDDVDREVCSVLNRIAKEIERLRGLRSTLIAHAVTGRIKV